MCLHGLKPDHAELRAANAPEGTNAFEVLALGGGEGLGILVPH